MAAMRFLICVAAVFLYAVVIHAETLGERLKLALPVFIYATPGIECAIYYDNIALMTNPSNYIFETICKKGIPESKRWVFTPSEKDVGTYPLTVSVWDEAGNTSQVSSTLIVASIPPDRAAKPVTILPVGDSLAGGSLLPQCAGKNGLPLKMIGTKKVHGNLCENYPGFSYIRICRGNINDNIRFFSYSGKIPRWDMARYFKETNNGVAPDFISIILGTNDSAIIHKDGKLLSTSLFYTRQMLKAFRLAAPDAEIGVGLPPPCASTQDAFGICFNGN